MPPAKQADTVTESWEEIQPFTEPRKMEIGEEIVAIYGGSNEVEVPAGANDDDETVITLDNGKRVRRALLHEFRDTPESEPYGIWGSAVLDKRLAETSAGSRVKIRYEGKQDLEGGRTARRYRVWVDKNAPF
jgi:hypothetical protein